VAYVTPLRGKLPETSASAWKLPLEIAEQIFGLLSSLQRQNSYLNGAAEPRPLSLGRVRGALSVYRRRVELLLRALDAQRQGW